MTRKTVRAMTHMTLLLLLVMIFVENGQVDEKLNRKTYTQSVTTKKNTQPTTCSPPSCKVTIACCRKAKQSYVCNTISIMDYLTIDNDCTGIAQDKNILKHCESVENQNIQRSTHTLQPSNTKQSGINMKNCEESLQHHAMTVLNIDPTLANGHVEITAPKVSDEARTIQIWIPVEPFQNVSDGIVGIVTSNSIQQFITKNVSIMSEVIQIEVFGRDIANLTNPLIIHFSVNNYTNNSSKRYTYSCQYYDKQGNNTWKTDGCNTTQISDGVVECSCDHMTPFAVLLVEVNNIDGQQWEILSYISYVGCSLSAVFSAFSVLTFIFNRNARAEVSSSIHVSLSSALFLLNMSFMFSEWAATWTVKEVCVFTAVTIHYSLLCSFTWMAVEALHLYLLLGRVFNIYIKHYMVKLSLIGWGVPAVLVGCLLSIQQLTRPFYGYKNVTLSNSNATNLVCWITEPLILYGVNLCYFTIVFLFNTIVLITVSRQIFKLKKVDNKHKKIPVKDASTVLGFMCLLGTSWGLVFLGSGYTSYPILYVFCISNTMQGFSIFLWMCRTTRPEKQKAAHTKSLSSVDTFTTEKQKQ
ncbi:adhesion G-protein coupled receptor G2 isoform X1 [Labeo rohita]|uniref:adhesion G-protein coupled receptor G2 isoform X1 n=2 Tax=Labeo rohita TaxID=84645 RepID=UPI0021E24F77|nr:adhesion G-protein coupled receptor G2 isoform X1 [Labeo rohita]